ncbi:MAG: dihydrolipoyl dehydrogenase, partial [Planctomycetota bacterium]
MVVGELTEQTDVVVIGGGPGGYVAAFRAADLGLQTTLVEPNPLLGGVCLREGCIPSKALLHVAHLIESAAEAQEFGVAFEPPKVDVGKLRGWKQSVVDKLGGGINTLAKKRNVRVIRGVARFESSKALRIERAPGAEDQPPEVGRLQFKHAIIATGSRAKNLPAELVPPDCATDSTDALNLERVPKTLLVIGGGYIGLELGQVYHTLGSRVTVLEVLDQILTGVDDDLRRPLANRLRKQFTAIITGARLERVHKVGGEIEVTFSKDGKQETQRFEQVLVSVGRQPCSDGIGLENTKVVVNERGFIEVDPARRTADKRIYAIGDVAGNPMLAHKASREGIVAAEAIAGKASTFDVRAIPAVVYTSPELAWCGLTEAEARKQSEARGGNPAETLKIGKFPWGASGRALAMGRPEGLTKIIADAKTGRVLGVGIVGEHAGDLISEAVLAIEMGAEAEDLALTIHPHP